MSNSKRKTKVNIQGLNFVISSDDNESYIKSVAIEVNEKINKILSKSSNISVHMATIMTALNLCDELRKSEGIVENLKSQIKEYVEITTKSQIQAEKLNKENQNLKNQLQKLNSK